MLKFLFISILFSATISIGEDRISWKEDAEFYKTPEERQWKEDAEFYKTPKERQIKQWREDSDFYSNLSIKSK